MRERLCPDEKTVEFTPTPLRIFARAAKAQRRIRDLLDQRISILVARRPSLDGFPKGTAVQLALEGLPGRATDELVALATLTEEELEELTTQAKLELATVDAGAIESQARQRDRDARALEAFGADLVTAAQALSPEVETRLEEARQSMTRRVWRNDWRNTVDS